MEFLRFCPCNWGTRKASGYCSQSERLLFGRDTRNLRRCFRRFVGRNRKSRRREAAGRRSYPEAVPNGEGENERKNRKQILRLLARTGITKEETEQDWQFMNLAEIRGAKREHATLKVV